MRQSCRPKHQVLILKCFPQYQKGVQEVKPNASELSYLLYYVSTRRSKLTKVCSFLEKRAARDVWRRKLGNVQVTLQILTALMEKVPRDLPIYARYVLSVIDIVLRSEDISMVEDSIATFETFCQYQDMASLAAEQELSTQYQGVVRTYASYADTKSSSQKTASISPMSIRWRNAGLRAIRGVVGSDETLAADGGDSLKLILPVILENLYTGEEDVLVLLQLKSQEPEKTQPELAPRRRVSVATVQTVDAAEGDPALASQTTADADRKAEMDVRLLALRCLEQIIVSGSSRGQIRVTTIIILRFILAKAPISNSSQEKAKGDTWATSLMELVAKWCPVQVRFIILNAAMEVLLETNPTEENLDRSATMIYMVDWLLKSSVNMIGLSVMDVLLGLMRYLSSVLSPGSEKAANGESEKHTNETPLTERRKELLDLLVESVGHLATHIYYGDQITDMVRTILSLLKPGANHEHSMTAPADTLDPSAKPATPPGEHAVAFSSLTAKVAALKAVKNVLVVASGKKPAASAGVESRNRVGIHVWEDTQWLLRDQREVYYTYADALLCWLRLETNESDARVSEPIGKPANPLAKQLPEIFERSGKRGSNSGNHRAKAVQVAQSNFLRLLHLTIYENALERSSEESETLLLHLLLTNLVDRLGVNAVRYGLPMILKLQSDVSAASLHSAASKVNIGSLIFGYLWKLTEKFDLDAYRVGGAINNEIDKRRNFGVWLDSVRLPPADLDAITPIAGKETSPGGLESPELLNPFGDDVQELVDRVEEAYNGSIPTPVQSPPSSPERGGANGTAPAIPEKEHLPASVKDEMLAGWDKEACLAAVQKDKARTLSINGSKAGTFIMRNHFHGNGFRDSSLSTASPVSALDGSGSITGGAAGLPDRRRPSVPEYAGTPMNSSSRGSAVRVNELRRVLSNNRDANARRLSPLRGRLDASNDSIVSSSSESMVSGYSASEFDGDGASSRPQSVVEGESTPPGDGVETPRASTFVLTDGQSKAGGIPPVPPIPPSLSIPSMPSLPGGFPSDSSQASTPLGERPVTAPALRKQASVNGSAGTYHAYRPSNAGTLNRSKSRSSTGLASAANVDGGYTEHDHGDSQRQLNDFLSSRDAERPKGTRRTGGISSRRPAANGGIGRPPY